MKNILNFKKNLYYDGKLLSAKNFQDEQSYHNEKRALINRLIYGEGVLSGMRVLKLDEETFCIEPGVAIDHMGRMIVIEKSAFKKASYIKGLYNYNDDIDFLLMAKYKEQLIETDVNIGKDKDVLSDSCIETYDIDIIPYDISHYKNSNMAMAYYKEEIFSSQHTKINIIVPKFIEKDDIFEVKFEIVNMGQNKSVKIDGEVLLNNIYFVDDKVNLTFDGSLFKNNIQTKSILLRADEIGDLDGKLTIKSNSLLIEINNETYNINDDFSFNIFISSDSYYNTLRYKYFNRQSSSDIDRGIALARIILRYEKDTAYINNILPMPFDEIVASNSYLDILSTRDIKRSEHLDISQNNYEENTNIYDESNFESKFESNFGISKINTPAAFHTNMYFESPQLSHGLGFGKVYIDVSFGVELNNELAFIAGNMDAISPDVKGKDYPDFEYAVVQFPDKGTFKVYIHMLSPYDKEHIEFCWYAKTDKQLLNEIKKDVSIKIEPNSVILKAGESIVFKGIIDGMRNQDIVWNLEDIQSGKMSSNGLYQAPKKSGVYKIIARSVENANLSANAFVVVK